MIETNNEKTTCIVCTEEYSNERKPHVLICGHTFCYECMIKLSAENDSVEIKCPVCRKVHWTRGILPPCNHALMNVVVCAPVMTEMEPCAVNTDDESDTLMTLQMTKADIEMEITELSKKLDKIQKKMDSKRLEIGNIDEAIEMFRIVKQTKKRCLNYRPKRLRAGKKITKPQRRGRMNTVTMNPIVLDF